MSAGDPAPSDSSESDSLDNSGAPDDPMGSDAILTQVCGMPEARALGDFLATASEDARRDLASVFAKLHAGGMGRGGARRGGKKASLAVVVGGGADGKRQAS